MSESTMTKIYYAVQVLTQKEGKFTRLYRALSPAPAPRVHFPRREIYVRRQGQTLKTLGPTFPGYIFLEFHAGADSEYVNKCLYTLRSVEGFCRILPETRNAAPLRGEDLELVSHFLSRAGSVAGVSRAYFDEEDRIRIIEGPLYGQEGRIVKVNRRKGRAKVEFNLCGNGILVDFGFEDIEKSRAKRVLA